MIPLRTGAALNVEYNASDCGKQESMVKHSCHHRAKVHCYIVLCLAYNSCTGSDARHVLVTVGPYGRIG